MMEKTENPDSQAKFEATRPMLMGLAYRLLGSHHDAEDVVQDVYESWLKADQASIKKPANWLSINCSRKAIDRLRARKRTQNAYPGEWLPEPVHTDLDMNAEQQILLSEKLTTAFLLLLEQLTPKERAAYLLHDIFNSDYDDIARTLEISETACRQLVSRARKRLKGSPQPKTIPRAEQRQLVSAFHDAVMGGNIDQLKTMLAENVTLYADSGGKAAAISKPVYGAKAVAKFFDKVLLPIWQESNARLTPCELNGQPGYLMHVGDTLTSAITFAHNRDKKTCAIYIMRNPDKLERLDQTFP